MRRVQRSTGQFAGPVLRVDWQMYILAFVLMAGVGENRIMFPGVVVRGAIDGPSTFINIHVIST